MEFLSARTTIAVGGGTLDVVVPMVVIMLFALLFSMWHVRQRLIGASAKTIFDYSVSESVTAATKSAQRKRRTYAQRKQARKVCAAKVAEPEPDVAGLSEACPASLVGEEAMSEQIDEEVGVISSDAQIPQDSVFAESIQTQSESEDEEIDAEVGVASGSSAAQQTHVAEAVRALDRAPAPREDVNGEYMVHKSKFDANDNVCSCADESAWGCARHRIYPSSLLLAHRGLSIAIATNDPGPPPGLELPPGLEPPEAESAKAFSSTRICLARRP